MSDTGNLFKQLTGPIDNLFKTLDSDKIVSSVLSLFLVLYGGMAAPKLPMSIAKLFKNTIFKLLIMSLIVYMSTKDTSTSILIVVAFVISMQTLTYQEAKSVLQKKKEAFTEHAKVKNHECKKNDMKRGCTTCNNGVRLRRPKILNKEKFTNSCSSTNDPYTIAKDVRHSRLNDLNINGIEFAKKNSGNIHGNNEDINDDCRNTHTNFEPLDNNRAECNQNNSPSSAPGSVENFDNTCTPVNGPYSMVTKDGRQVRSVTSNSEWLNAKNGLDSEGEKIKNPNPKRPISGATAAKELITGYSDLYTWDLKNRGNSNYGCASAPLDITKEGRWNQFDDIKTAKVGDDEYSKNHNNGPASLEWNAKSDHRM